MREYSLGIDTSNYKTSVALVSKDEEIVYDKRTFLTVKEGSIGLRQQEALFQHISNLPELLEGAFNASRDGKIVSVSASSRPRPVENSYMPCFIAGMNECKIISSLLNCKMSYFSHQEGHLASAVRFTKLRDENEYIFFHFSGGTTEILIYSNGKIKQIGQSDDISFGQLLDRTGNMLDYSFPAGEDIDKLALSFIDNGDYKNILPKIKVNGLKFNLSGIETAVKNSELKNDKKLISFMLMERILECIETIIKNASNEYGIKDFLFSGGVSSSWFIRNGIDSSFNNEKGNLNVYFSSPELSSDNAVGIAFLGGDLVWRETL